MRASLARISRTILYLALGSWIAASPVLAAQPSTVRPAGRPVALLVDGRKLHTSPPPMLRGGRVYVPVTVFRKIGLAVKVSSSREAWVGWPKSDNIRDFKADVRKYVRGPYEGETVVVTLPGTPFVHRGVLMVPLRSLLSDRDTGTALVGEWDPRSMRVHVHRSKSWLRWRLEQDAEFVRAAPDLYSHVWLGEYVPVLPKKEIARAETLDASGNWQEAAKILRSLVESRPFTWETQPWHVRDEWKAYGPLGRILVREHPDRGEGYLYLGIDRALNKDYSGAEEAFRRGAELDPASADLQFAIGWAVLREEPAEATFQRKPETLHNALTYFEKALEINPRHEPALRAAGHASLALAYLESHLGGYTVESKERARPYLEKAVGYFERLLLQAPSPLGHYRLWDIYRQSGNQDKALEHYRQYVFAISGRERWWRLRHLAEMYDQAGKPEEAAAIRRLINQ